MSKNAAAVSLRHRVERKIKKMLRDLFRDQLRRKMAFTAPSPFASKDLPFSPHTLACHENVLLTVCSAKSLNLAVGKALPWVFHDDGSLTDNDKHVLLRQFPGSRLVARAEADRFYEERAREYPHIHAIRKRAVMLLKLADVYAFAERERILYCDSDVLFAQRPVFLIERLSKGQFANYFNKDVDTRYVADLSVLRDLTGMQPPERINAGLSILNRTAISLERIEAVLRRLDYCTRTDWSFYEHLIEQTIVATLAASSAGGAHYLPAEYDVSLDKPVSLAVSKHYVGAIRHQYELEGVAFLIRERGFLQRWQEFARGS